MGTESKKDWRTLFLLKSAQNKVKMRMVGTEVVSAALHASDPEPDSGTNGDPMGEHGDNGSSGSNDDMNGDHSPLPPHSTHYDSSDGAILVHRCDKCETYETLSRTALVAHMARCSLGSSDNGDVDVDGRRGDRKLFECDVCNMKFSNGANMRRHKMRHTGVKPYECRVCQKRFFRKDHLAEHFTTHTKTLPYHCPICNRGFQRQIAMRAHFQNEHVGQHDMIKSCPLCSYRAGTMKSLRVHFFNRHGIDLDNPGTNSPSALLKVEATPSAIYSDSGDSQGGRSADNTTPPMHFLTPHVEISMTESAPFSPGRGDTITSESRNGDSHSPQSGDSNVPTSSLHCERDRDDREQVSPPSAPPSPPPLPALSVFPLVKQESPETDDMYNEKKNGIMAPVNLSMNNNKNNNVSPPPSQPPPNSGGLIKVSPLKSLLRDDLKRKLTSRANLRIRPLPEPTNLSTNSTTPPLIVMTGDEHSSPRKEMLPPHVLALQNLQCVFCGIWFPDQTLYFLHKGCHCESNPWKCNICGEQCANVYQFNSHLLSNTHQ